MIRILFLNFEYPPLGGGGANANFFLFREFANIEGVFIDLVTSAEGQNDQEISFSKNIRIFRLAVGKKERHFWTKIEVFRYLLRAHRMAGTLLASNEYHLCHAFFGFPSGFLAWLRHKRLPYLVSLRGSDVPGFNPGLSWDFRLLTPLFRRIWHTAGAVVANSQGLRSLALKTTPDLPIQIIPNGIDADRFVPPSKSDPREKDHLLCVSRLVERKGVQHLLDALPKVLRQRPEGQLTIVGEGDLAETLRRQARALGIEGRVHFCGFVPHEKLPYIYQRASILVQPSFYEGMSNSVLEAMACGLPIVTSGAGGHEELVRGNARVVPYGNSDALAEELVNLLGQPEKLAKMGKISREIALGFSWGGVARSYHDLYCQIAAKS